MKSICTTYFPSRCCWFRYSFFIVLLYELLCITHSHLIYGITMSEVTASSWILLGQEQFFSVVYRTHL
jgi:hypothetical protein